MVLKCIIIVNIYQVPNCCSTDDVYLITNNFNNSLTWFVIIHIKTVLQNGSIQMFWTSKNASQLGIKILVIQTHPIATYFKSFTPEHYINFPNTLQFLQAPPNANRPSVSLVSILKTYVECIYIYIARSHTAATIWDIGIDIILLLSFYHHKI